MDIKSAKSLAVFKNKLWFYLLKCSIWGLLTDILQLCCFNSFAFFKYGGDMNKLALTSLHVFIMNKF